MGRSLEQVNMTAEDFNNLRLRLKNNQLSQEDITNLQSILNVIANLRQLVEKRKFGLLKLLRQLFGFKTEKKDQKQRLGGTAGPGSKSSSGSGGRAGRNDYPGADSEKIEHESLNTGDNCPECMRGCLCEAEDGVDYEWSGNSPLSLKVFHLGRLICHSCKTTFTADSPVLKTVDDSESPEEEKTARCDKNAKANATVGCLRFQYGVPHYRLAKIQNNSGMSLPVSTQYRMLQQVYYAGREIYKVLIYNAAQGSLLKADDTGIKILDWLAGKGPAGKVHATPRKKATTTAIVSASPEGRRIVLYMTGAREAGSHVREILLKREEGREAPLYMADGLAANNPGSDIRVIQLHCLVHARRNFYDIKTSFPGKCGYVLEELKKVWKTDSEARNMNMSPEERLIHHQKHSRPVMDSLGGWLMENLQSGAFEKNGELGKAANYMLKRWSELNEFHHIPGVPLCNSETERMIKFIVTHRKNSLFFKTDKGAEVGDVIQSLIATCERCGTNPIKYLAWIQEKKTQAVSQPEKFLPWMLPP